MTREPPPLPRTTQPEEIAYGTLKLDIFPRFEPTPEAVKLFEERDDLIEPIPVKGGAGGS